jgi:hypothetical protein
VCVTLTGPGRYWLQVYVDIALAIASLIGTSRRALTVPWFRTRDQSLVTQLTLFAAGFGTQPIHQQIVLQDVVLESD